MSSSKKVICGLTSAVVLLVYGACSSDEFESGDPSKKADAGDGEAGDASNESASGCSKDDDCDDHDPCTGKESCNDGKCKAGTPVECQAAEHCVSTCIDNAGTAECKVTAADLDGDQHGDIACSEVPGDDCNDDEPAAHPGATEACDGIDNDCDGKDDLADGLALAGAPGTFYASTGEAYEPAVAWSDAGFYGVTFTSTHETGERVYLLRMAPDGTKLGDPLKLSTANLAAHTPEIAATATQFGVVWEDGQVHFQRVDSTTGALVGTSIPITQSPSTLLGASPSIVRAPTVWVISYASKDATGITIRARTVDDNGTVGNEIEVSTTKTTNPTLVDSALVGDTLGVVWEHSPPASPNSVLFFGRASVSPSFSPLGASAHTPNPPPVGVLNHGGHVGAGIFGLALAWRHAEASADAVQLSIRTADGNVVCGPVAVPSTQASEVQALGASSLGPLALTVDGANTLSLQRLTDACAFVDAQVVTASEILPPGQRTAAIARGSQGYAVVWTREPTGGGNTVLSRRVFGPHLCD